MLMLAKGQAILVKICRRWMARRNIIKEIQIVKGEKK